MTRTILGALAAGALITSGADAAVIVYQFSGPIISNSMTSGGFAGAPVGAPVTLQITVETSSLPIFTNPGRKHWDGVSGTILGMKATVNGYTAIAAPDSAPVYARVANDAPNGGSFMDQFWIEADAQGSTPDFTSGTAILSTIGAAPPISSSLTTTDFPITPAELDAASFANEHYILLKGDIGSHFLRANLTSVSVVPAPGVGVIACLGLGLAARRRR